MVMGAVHLHGHAQHHCTILTLFYNSSTGQFYPVRNGTQRLTRPVNVFLFKEYKVNQERLREFILT